MLKIQNPFAVSADQQAATAAQPAVVAWLQANPGNKVVTLAELRTALPAIAATLTRGVVNQICQNIGANILNPEDSAP